VLRRGTRVRRVKMVISLNLDAQQKRIFNNLNDEEIETHSRAARSSDARDAL
jgi:hypothetical protein